MSLKSNDTFIALLWKPIGDWKSSPGRYIVLFQLWSEIRNFIVQPYSNRIRKWYGAHHFMRAFQTTTYDARVSFRECLPITPGRTGQDRPLIKCFVASVNQSWIWCDYYTTSESKLCFCRFTVKPNCNWVRHGRSTTPYSVGLVF